ncbi:hypothetical protein [Pseudomonas sp.]|uniref:hypothetical protein n=1 Tax=Pseudomonas sp. TaxID=306 RepID=UPI002605AE11|nr:hypothetical protein [Pseudomonas sp.]
MAWKIMIVGSGSGLDGAIVAGAAGNQKASTFMVLIDGNDDALFKLAEACDGIDFDQVFILIPTEWNA